MPTNIDLSKLSAAQGSTEQPTPDAGSAKPPSVGAGSPPAAGAGDDAERARRAAEGRRAKELQDKVDSLTSLVISQQNTLSQFGASLSAREQREFEAHLESLPPDERLAEEVKMLRARIDAMQSRTTQPVAPVTSEDPVAYQARRMQEILDEVNEQYAVGITAQERDALLEQGVLDDSSEEAYARSLKQIAYTATRGQQAASSLQSQGGVGAQQGGAVAKTGDQDTQAQIEERARQIAEEHLRELGISRPNSARPTPPPGKATSDDYRNLSRSFDSRLSPKQRIAKIQQYRGV